MDDRELFARFWQDEAPRFRRVLEALPEDHLDFRPHERSRSARELAWTIADVTSLLAKFLGAGEAHWEWHAPPASLHEILSAYDRAAQAVAQELAKADDGRWDGWTGRLLAQGELVWEAPFREMAWGYLFDLVHHRGQLSVYIRPMGGRVPAIYGPSGDFPTG
ncbi:hypothetical protein HRbin10_02217 [bacterium HR10]|nr:hypothetical protein HRbin10_02217 [bacterium HR10]